MNQRSFVFILGTAATLLAGCAAAPRSQTNVAYRTVDPAGTKRYELREDDVSNIPVMIENTAPVYPQTAVALRLPHVGVRAQVIVNEEGHVSDVRIDPPIANDIHPGDFDDAVRTAVASWRYEPLHIRRFEDVLDSQGNVTDSRVVSDEAKPFSLNYQFDFDFRDGKPIVTQANAGAK
jgi:hypothetical protein